MYLTSFINLLFSEWTPIIFPFLYFPASHLIAGHRCFLCMAQHFLHFHLGRITTQTNMYFSACTHMHAGAHTYARVHTHTRATTLNTVGSWGGQRSEIKKVAKNNLCKLALATAIRNSSSTIIALSGLLRTHALASAENFHTINSIIHTTNSIIHVK